MTDTTKATVSFFAYARAGISASVGQADAATSVTRPSVPVTVALKGGGSATVPVGLYGPGDILEIDPAQILRTDPEPYASSFPPNLFACIEFDRPDYPWLFSPFAPATDRLRPWLVLVVVRRDRVELDEAPEGGLAVLTVGEAGQTDLPTVPDQELPNLADAWAWAHVEAVGDVAPAALEALNRDHPDRIKARLLSPRRLRAEARYLACLVPAFEAGRLAGLGLDPVSVLKPAWSAGAAVVRLPVYHHWEFSTGPAGDFVSLARRLAPLSAPSGVGTRPLDATTPGAGLPSAGKLRLQGALKPRDATPGPDPEAPFSIALEGLLNAPALAAADPSRPITVAPPLYGGRLAGRTTVPASPTSGRPEPERQPPWLRELNLDPRHRAAAAIGTRIVQRDQEQLMAAAWAQVGEIDRANEALRQAQLACAAGRVIHTRRLTPMDAAALLALTAPTHGRVVVYPSRPTSPTETLLAKVRSSRLSERVLGSAFRRVASPRGPLARRFDPEQRRGFRTLRGRLNAGEIAPAGPRIVPRGAQVYEGLANLTAAAVASASVQGDFRLSDPTGADLFILPHLLQQAAMVHQNAMGATFALGEPPAPVALDALVDPDTPAASSLAAPRAVTLAQLDPERTIPARMQARLTGGPPGWQPADPLEPVMAAPTFPRPMFEALRELSQELVLPGLELIKVESVTVLEVNDRFVNAFMIGLNHEMSRELLWRGYPTDLRGTTFSQFWDPSARVPPPGETVAPDLRDLPPVHGWPPTKALSDGAGAAGASRVVLVVRGELLRRFPGASVLLVKAEPGTPRQLGSEERYPIFQGRLQPDVTFFGFDIRAEDARGDPGWFFVLQQEPTEGRFGLPDAVLGDPGQPAPSWELLSWGHLASDEEALASMTYAPAVPPPSATPTAPGAGPAWGTHAADIAAIARRQQVRIAIHASQMLST